MSKKITKSQLIGEIGEAAARSRFLTMGFQFDGRSRLETGIDGIAEVMQNGLPLAKMIAVQVKASEKAKYTGENDKTFSYLLRTEDLKYWRNANLPIILVLYRQADESYYWKEISLDFSADQRKLQFDKTSDILNRDAADAIAQLTVPKAGRGYYVPPLGGGEDAIVNMFAITLPDEIYVSSTSYSLKQAQAVLFGSDEEPRFDWAIKGRTFWSFHDPRNECTRKIVDQDQVEVIQTLDIALHEDIDEQNNFSFLLKQILRHQCRKDLDWDKSNKVFYFRAYAENTSRKFNYMATKNQTETNVVNAAEDKKKIGKTAFVRHHAFAPRFELILDQWFLIITPTYHFTTNGFVPHSYPDALLSGKKRLDNNASLRGQVIMWHRFLSDGETSNDDLFASHDGEPNILKFSPPPTVALPTTVPEKAWNAAKPSLADESDEDHSQGGFDLD